MGFSKLYAFIRPYRGLCFVSALSLLIFTGLGIPLPWFLKVIIDHCLEGNYGFLALMLFGILLTYALREIFFYVSHYLFYYTGQRILFGGRVKLFKHLQSLSLRFMKRAKFTISGLIQIWKKNSVLMPPAIFCIVQIEWTPWCGH